MNNMKNIMAQAQRMQMEIQKKQEEVQKMTFVGKSEWITATVNGKKEVLKIDINYEGDLNEDRDMLADMILIALSNALKQVDKEYEKKLGAYSSQLGGLI